MRKAVVTRTITFKRCAVMALDTLTTEVKTFTIDYTGQHTDNDKILRDLQKDWTLDSVKLVTITSIENHEKLYGMYEDDFIRLATELPDRTGKPNVVHF